MFVTFVVISDGCFLNMLMVKNSYLRMCVKIDN